MNKSEQINELATALAKAQGELENAAKSSNNLHFKSKYADLAEILNTVRPVFSANGLSVSQCPSFEAGIVSVETVLMHSSGQWMSSVISAPVSKQDAQGVGSAITYCRRYSLAAVAGIAQEDDDANSAVGHAPRPQAPQAAPKPKVTTQQIEQLRKAITVAGISEADWCEIAKIPSLDMLPAERFEGAMAYIKAQAQGNAA
ncbi:ERF family protein [Azotobacter vinelandii]|uniref:ERF family protein n=1 Tax=Azotobacter vinelandii TaxID=354 RepID=UPI0026670738|nr:ERF family protein [Azotobacter vinelandii]WKN20859.1 ERF family protein [Azotobacter vinelandii]